MMAIHLSRSCWFTSRFHLKIHARINNKFILVHTPKSWAESAISSGRSLRCFSTSDQKTKKDTKKYSHTIVLPKTDFPGYIKPSERPLRDANITNTCNFEELYSWQRQNVIGPDFILHDGPPYANGPVHLGHAVNKILKDIANRERLLSGHKIHYIPGWDCHGLPIEAKALGEREKSLTALKVRQKARKFSEETISDQSAEFKSWGIMADWGNPYRTSSPECVKNQLRCFQKLYDRSLVFRDLKPVYWSPGSKTALAESELVYNHNHSSLSVFVRSKISHLPAQLADIVSSIHPAAGISLVAWTSTYWSLPANQAVAYGPNLQYCLVACEPSSSSGDLLVVCRDLLDILVNKLGLNPTPLATFSGELLKGAKYKPFFENNNTGSTLSHANKELPLIPSSHVTNSAGTGLVHIAPGHGQQDFLLALENELPLHQTISEDMCYTHDAPTHLQGMNILASETKEKILSELEGGLMFSEPFVHSYPYDWRAHCPVVMLASRQWFLSTDALRTKAEEAVDKVMMYPKPDQEPSPLVVMLRKRPYWCISRQRVWGVPIPAVYRKSTGEAIVHRAITERMCSLIDEKDTDFWWTNSTAEIVPAEVLKELNCSASELELGNDILDIWVDSGLTWSHVLGPNGQSDLCVEGIDQSTGWFQSSLLLSTALQGKAPYRSLLFHGFVVDEKGLKMSKSVGNVISPKELLKGTSKLPAIGLDVLRCWVACQAVGSSNIPASPGTLKAASETISRLRTVARFLLGCVDTKARDVDMDTSKWIFLDRLMLHRLHCFHKQINQLYLQREFHQVMTRVNNFVASEVSAHYCHLVRDRLYCSDLNSQSRQQCVNVLGWTLETLLRSFAPIVPHLAEEICLHLPGRGKLFYTSSFKTSEDWNQSELEGIWDTLQQIRSTIFKMAGEKNSQELGVTLEVPRDLYTLLKRLQPEDESFDSELCELLQVAAVALQPVTEEEPFAADMWSSPRTRCLRCRRFTALLNHELCPRCDSVVNSMASKK